MDLNNNYIIVNPESIKEKKCDFFISSCEWPVSEEDFRFLSDMFRETYIDLALSLEDDFLFEFSLIELNFIIQLLYTMHFNYIKNYSNIYNKKIVLNGHKNIYLNPDFYKLGNYYSNHMSFPFRKGKRAIRRFIKNIVFNRHLGVLNVLKGIVGNKSVIGIGSNDRIKSEYIKHNSIFCDHIDWPDLLGKTDYSATESDFINAFEKNIIHPFIQKIRKNGGLFSQGLPFELIEKQWKKRAMDLHSLIESVSYDGKAKTLLVTEAAKPHSKAIVLGLRKKGFRVIHFSHGNESGLLNQKLLHQSVISHAHEYVFETETIRARFEKSTYNRPIESRTNTVFHSINSNLYSNLRKTKLIDNTCSGVMLIGYPMNLYRDPDESHMFFHHKARLEYKILRILKDTVNVGKVIYKAHPDRLSEVKGMYESYADKIVVEKFEKVITNNNVLIFTYVSTTTFCYAINLPVPIILFNIKGTPWYNGMDSILSKRVAYVDCHYEGGVPYFKESDLVKALTEAKLKINLNVAEEITG